jgi:hypothetical protein
VSNVKSSAADLVISPAFRLSPITVRLLSPPAARLLHEDLPEAWQHQHLQLPAPGPIRQAAQARHIMLQIFQPAIDFRV